MSIAIDMEMISGKRTVGGQHSGKRSTEGAIFENSKRNSQVNNRAKRHKAFLFCFFIDRTTKQIKYLLNKSE